VKILKAIVFTNPIPEADDLLEQFIRKNMSQRIASSKHKAVSTTGSGSSNEATSKILPAQDSAASKVRKLG
jgi:hypothetical protein